MRFCNGAEVSLSGKNVYRRLVLREGVLRERSKVSRASRLRESESYGAGTLFN